MGGLNSSPDDDQCDYRELAENLEKELTRVRSERDNLQHIIDAQLIASQGPPLEGLLEVLEAELSCTICTEVVIEPTVAQCGHVFCSHCIIAWMRQSKNSCPCCRKIILTSARVSTWDNFLTRAYNLLPEETRQSRERILREREKEHGAWEARQAASRAEVEIMRLRQNEASRAPNLSRRLIMRNVREPTAAPVGRPAHEHERDVQRLEEALVRIEFARIRLERANEARIQRRGEGT